MSAATLLLPFAVSLAQAGDRQSNSVYIGAHLRPDTYVVDSRFSSGRIDNLTRLYVEPDGFVASLQPVAPAPADGGARALSGTGHLHLVNERLDEALLSINGAKVGHAHALTEVAVHQVAAGCYDITWDYRDDSQVVERACTVASLRAPSPGGPSSAAWLETGRPPREEPEWRFGPADRDRDGLIDDEDECPTEAGPASSFGCPDGDQDRVPDHRDACPLQAGPAKADPLRSDGCPSRVFVAAKEIVITDKIFFQTNKSTILPTSFPLMEEIAAVLVKHPEILKVEIAGHTDSTGNAAKNVKLSQERAAAVVSWLVAKGIDSGRLVARGYGPERPIADNTTEEGKATNRRVEFNILEQKAAAPLGPRGAEATPEGPAGRVLKPAE